MTRAIVRKNHNLRDSIQRSAGRVFIAAALNLFGLSANAQQPAPVPGKVAAVAPVRSLAEVEKIFWLCDHAASTYGVVDASTAIPCVVATEDLKMRKFKGEFNTMLVWWQQNKAGQHAALDIAYGATLR